jgi:hypothetical protein
MENYPIFDKMYIEINNDKEIYNNFEYYCNWARKHVEDIQFNSVNKIEIPLTFYPIAKNIRIPSSHMVKNILSNKSSFIHNKSKGNEANFWKNIKNRGSWFPWLWARGRIEGDYKNIDGWKFYFDSFTKNHNKIYDNGELKEPDNKFKLFFIYLACIKYTFQLNEKYIKLMDDYKKKMNWPGYKEKILAVQIRRGETCTKDCSKSDRELVFLDKYIKNIELLLEKNDYEYIYISTDSNEEIQKIKEIKPQWKILSLPIDRTKFFRMNKNAKPSKYGGTGEAIDLEDSCRQNPSAIPFIVDTGLSDLYFISKCHGYISTLSNGEFSRCGWYLQISEQKCLTPYINLNTKLLNLSEKNKLLNI